MGTCLNPGIALFAKVLSSDIYVDKTEMIGFLNGLVNTSQKYLCVSRPRRFGKTMAADMLSAYYGRGANSRELFGRTRLAALPPVPRRFGEPRTWDAYLGAFDVVRITMTSFVGVNHAAADAVERLQKAVMRELLHDWPDVDYFDTTDLAMSLQDVHDQTGASFVFIVDEWDAPFRARKDDADGQRAYLEFLRNLLKDKAYVALAYMTGILPVKKHGQHSALNMFDEYSMVAPLDLAPYTGFTEGEVRALCEEYRMDFDDVRDWYDGYEVRGPVPLEARGRPDDTLGYKSAPRYALYSPLSIVKAARTGVIANYWNNTETYRALAEYIRMDFDGLKGAVALLMDGGRVHVDLGTYQNDMTTFERADDVLALLVHLGYLGWDSAEREAFVPNKEVLEVFRDSTRAPEWDLALREYEQSKRLVRATWDGDARKVAELLEAAHDRAANKDYNGEAALSYAVQLAYYAARRYYTSVVELDSGKGFADVCYLPSPRHPEAPALVVELKRDAGARTALDQIRERRYPDRLEHYAGNILLVGVSYDRDARPGDPAFKRHTCVIERA